MLSTTVIGSYPQPDWLMDKDALRNQRVPRVSQPGLWKVDDALRAEAIQDAVRNAVRDMEDAGIDIVTDGEIGRESYSNHFLGSLSGIDFSNPATVTDRRGRDLLVPRVTGPITRNSFVEEAPAKFLKSVARVKTKVTLPGAFTMAQQCKDEFYGDTEALAFALADAVNAEAVDLANLGIDVVQFDEPWFRNDPEAAKRYGCKLVDRTIDGVNAITAIHMCFGYGFLVPGSKPRAYDFLEELAETAVTQISVEAAQPNLDLAVLDRLGSKAIMVGVLDLSSNDVEPVEVVAKRIRNALVHISPDRLMPAPDCGMKYLSRDAAKGKLAALGTARDMVLKELGG